MGPASVRACAVLGRLMRRDFNAWAQVAQKTGYCSRPIRLTGSAVSVDTASGEVRSRFSSDDQADRVLYVRCGNRRAHVCPSCSHEYKGDAWHILAAGASGGMKGVPESVATHPLVFLTLTAPSFGAVHRSSDGPCHARDRVVCEHGVSMDCRIRHRGEDSAVGQPLCADCYDYLGQIMWQWAAPELWRRFTIQLKRELARVLGITQRAFHRSVRVQFAKVAEFQRRGAVHFHALVRLDGPATAANRYPAPLLDVDREALVDAVGQAASAVSVRVPRIDAADLVSMRFGGQVDARVVRGSEQQDDLDAEQVASYLAKYTTKASDGIEASALGRSPHLQRLRDMTHAAACRADLDPHYSGLARWSKTLGFRGHFATKSRHFSTTFSALRAERRNYQSQPDDAEQPPEESTLIVQGSWSFDGVGWVTAADHMLVAAAAEERLRRFHERRKGGSHEVRAASPLGA